MKMDEEKRLAALREYGILDTGFEAEYDRITRLVAQVFQAPVVLLSLVDENRLWFKAAHGYELREVPREATLCAQAITRPGLYVVPDTSQEDRFSHYANVSNAVSVRFYAGAPLVTPNGYAIGTLCVIDDQPRDGLDDRERKMLEEFAGLVMDQLERRRG